MAQVLDFSVGYGVISCNPGGSGTKAQTRKDTPGVARSTEGLKPSSSLQFTKRSPTCKEHF